MEPNAKPIGTVSQSLTSMDTYVLGIKDGLDKSVGILLSVWVEMTGGMHPDADKLFKEAKKRIEAKANEY